MDTGASYSLLHASVAPLLGIKLEDGRIEEMTIGNGDTLTVYLHDFEIMVAGVCFKATIGFSKDLNINLYIIGRKDIFDRFTVAFREWEKSIEFDEHVA